MEDEPLDPRFGLLFLCLMIGVACVLFLFVGCEMPADPDTKPCPSCPAKPAPTPPDKPKPWRPRSASVEAEDVGRPHLPRPKPRPKPAEDMSETISLGGPVAPDGVTEVQCDLPIDQCMKNRGGSDGAGMCVMTSIEHSARWQALEQFRGLRDWCAKQPGGGYPEKVDRQLKEYCSAKGIGCPNHLQYLGSNPAVLELALATGRLPSATYSGRDGVRYAGRIAHMICLAHFDSKWAAVRDNNGDLEKLIWMSPSEFLERWKSGNSGWLFLWLSPPPMPIPVN